MSETCDKCRAELKPYHELSSGRIILCPRHDGSIAEKLAEALKDFQMEGSRSYFERIRKQSKRLLAEYEKGKG